MTEAMKRAYEWLDERGGSGVIDRYGRVVATGEVATQSDASTWLRLMAAGHLKGDKGRVLLVGPPPTERI